MPPVRTPRRKTPCPHPPPPARLALFSAPLRLRGELSWSSLPLSGANYDARSCQSVRLCVLCRLWAPRGVRRRGNTPRRRPTTPFSLPPCVSAVNSRGLLCLPPERIMTPAPASPCGSVPSAARAHPPTEDAVPTPPPAGPPRTFLRASASPR